MTAMTKLSCKQTSPSLQTRYTKTPQYQGKGYVLQSKTFWESDQPVVIPPSNSVRGHHRSMNADQAGKRRSAVELLQESKAFYVKSENVLDRKQELKNSGHFHVSQVKAPNTPLQLLKKSCPQLQTRLPLQVPVNQCYWSNTNFQGTGRTLPPKSSRLTTVSLVHRRSVPPITTKASSNSDRLQIRLRKLLKTDSKEKVLFLDKISPTKDNAHLKQIMNDSIINEKEGETCIHSSGINPSFLYGEDKESQGYMQSRHIPSIGNFRSIKGDGRSGAISSVVIDTSCHKSLPDLRTTNQKQCCLSCKDLTKNFSREIQSSPCPGYKISSDCSDHNNRNFTYYRSGSSSRQIRCSIASDVEDSEGSLSSKGRLTESSKKSSHNPIAEDCVVSSGNTEIIKYKNEPFSKVCLNQRDSYICATTPYSFEQDRSRKSSNPYENKNLTSTNIKKYTSYTSSSSINNQDNSNSNYSSRLLDGWNNRNSPILRSKSDVSDRYRRYDSNNSRIAKSSARPQHSLTQVEKFFDQLGLEPDSYRLLTEPTTRDSSPIFFDSVSSVDSAVGIYSAWSPHIDFTKSCADNVTHDDCGATSSLLAGRTSADTPSIVERNARIIKWIFQCKKVQYCYS